MSGSALCIPRTETERASLFLKHNYNVLSPNFHIHVSVSDLYIPRIGRPIPGIYKSLTDTHECRNWERGHTVSFLRIHKLDFWYKDDFFCQNTVFPFLVEHMEALPILA